MKAKHIYILLTIAAFLLCVLIVKLFANQAIIRGFLGDVLVMGLLYFFLRIFIASKPRLLALAVLIFAFLIEGLQYIQVVHLLGWQNNRMAVIVIGATYDPIDLLAYIIGILTVYFMDMQLILKKIGS